MNVFELFGTIAIKNKDANAAIGDTTQRAERAGKKIQAAFKNIGTAAVKIAKPIIAGTTAAATAIAATAEKTRDYRTAMAKLDTAFVTHGHSAETAYNTYKALQSVLGETDTAVEAANHLAVLCKNEEDLSKWTDICTGVFATFGDSLPIEGLTESANETAKVGQVTGTLADALNWCGINEDDFNKKLKACTSEEKRQKLIMDTLYWSYRDASEQYKETGENVIKANEAQEKLNKAMGKLGDIAEPVVTSFKSWVADMVTASIPYLESMIAKFEETGSVWESFIWPLIQDGFKIALGIEYPDWETFKANLKSDWEYVKAAAEKDVVIQAIIDIPKNYSEIGQKIVEGWESVKTYIKDAYRVTFGVDMPSWNDIALDIALGWDETIQPHIDKLFKVSFGVDMPSWSDIAMKIARGWDSVMGSIGGMFNVGAVFGTGMLGRGIEISSNGAGVTFPDSSNASGLDRVPRDGYIARVHKDEAILNSRDAAEWRSGGSGRVEALLGELVNIMRAGQVIQLDSGIMAGQLTPAIDARLGTVASRKGRGN
jgi:hypothetical protein